MLSAVQTSMRASSSSSTSCQRLGWRLSGALVWASSSTMISLGRRASAPSRSNSSISRPCQRTRLARQDFEALRQRFGFGARMGLDQADDDVDAFLAQQPGALQHRVGLADARRGAEEHQQLAALALLGQRQQRVRVGSAFGIAVVGQGFGASLRVEAIIAHGRPAAATPLAPASPQAAASQTTNRTPVAARKAARRRNCAGAGGGVGWRTTRDVWVVKADPPPGYPGVTLLSPVDARPPFASSPQAVRDA